MADPVSAGTTSYTYDAAGRLTGRTEANGIVTTVSYSATDQLTSKTEVAGSTTLASWTNVTYDLAQNRTAETLAYYAGNPYPDAQAGTSTYQYDTENQLNGASLPGKTAAGYLYDGAHNLTSNAGTTQTYNPNESLQTVGSATTGADADGNQLRDASGNALSWNSLSQLQQFGSSETYTYDGLGRLSTVTNGASVSKFVYQGLSGQVVQELNSSNAVVRAYAWDTMGRQLYLKSGGSAYYLITDPHGDNIALASSSALAGTAHFDPWGNPTYTPSGTTTPFGFQGAAGSWTDAASGFVSMGLRWYYPRVSEFLSSDPLAGTASPRTPVNRTRWLYGRGDPLTNSDPTGLINASDPAGGCDDACQAAMAAAQEQAAADARENNEHSMLGGKQQSSLVPQATTTATHPVCGRAGCTRQSTEPCKIGSQDCGTFAMHAAQSFLGDLCGITICPMIASAQATYDLVTDPSGYWQSQTEQWSADKAYWSEQWKTLQQFQSGPLGGIPMAPEALFAMKWTADRIGDFENDPGSGTGHILFFDASLLAGRALPELPGASVPESDTITLYHGSTRTAGTRILERGFRPGRDGAVYLAEDMSTASHFAQAAVAARAPAGAVGSILRMTMPTSFAARFGRGVIGAERGLPFVDVAGGTGFERIVSGDMVSALNQGIRDGIVQVVRFAASI